MHLPKLIMNHNNMQIESSIKYTSRNGTYKNIYKIPLPQTKQYTLSGLVVHEIQIEL